MSTVFVSNTITNNSTICYEGLCHHGSAHPPVADGGDCI